MESEVTFYDYVDASGSNIIHEWLDTLPVQVKVKLNNILVHLEATKVSNWTRPFVDTLTDECQGLFELRAKRGRIQYRILGAHGPGRNMPTLLHGIIKGGDAVPPAECDETFSRKDLVNRSPFQRRVEHNYG